MYPLRSIRQRIGNIEVRIYSNGQSRNKIYLILYTIVIRPKLCKRFYTDLLSTFAGTVTLQTQFALPDTCNGSRDQHSSRILVAILPHESYSHLCNFRVFAWV